jgi:hypothetical protein
MYKDKDKEAKRQSRLDFINSLPLPITAIKRDEADEQSIQPTKPYVYQPKSGYIYVIHCSGFPYYKIGQTVMPRGRIDALQTGVPFELILEYAIQVKDMNEVEYKIHQRYEERRIRGEWYLLTDKELEAVKEDITTLKDYVLGQDNPLSQLPIEVLIPV